ncbi:MAG: hypothetical protein ACREOH_21770 [Candidatus Entotheonellia bacterium]
MIQSRFEKFLAAFRHAFAVEVPHALSAEDRALLERIASTVVQRRMTGPALLVLESLRPLNYVSSQMLLFLAPLVGSVVSTRDYDRMARILEHRESLQILIDTILAQEASLRQTEENGGR